MGPSPSSPGERLFSAYLRQRRLSANYERDVGGRNPDFLVSHPNCTVACDVFEPELRLPSSGAFSFSSYPALRRVFKPRKRKQAQAAAQAGLPFVHVLARTNSDLSFDPLIVAGAMLGDLTFTFPVFPDGNAPEGFDARDHTRNLLGANRQLQPTVNTSVSAIAILRSFNPTQWRHEVASAAHFQRFGPVANFDDAGRRALVHLELVEHMERVGAYDATAHLARLIVMHNPWARIPLALEVFGGPHDEQWSSIELQPGELGYAHVASGRLAKEVPGILVPD